MEKTSDAHTLVFLQRQKTEENFTDPERGVKQLPPLTHAEWTLPSLTSSPVTLQLDHAPQTSTHTYALTHTHTHTQPKPSSCVSGCVFSKHTKTTCQQCCVTWSTCSLSLTLHLMPCHCFSPYTKPSPLMLSR